MVTKKGAVYALVASEMSNDMVVGLSLALTNGLVVVSNYSLDFHPN